MFGEIARALGVPCPRLFVRTDVRGGVVHMPVFPLASLSGNDVLRLADRELCLLLSAHVAAYRPESYLATVLPHPRSLATAFHAALRITGSVERSHAGVESLAEQLTRRLTPARVEALCMLARQLSIDLPPAELHDVLVAAAERWLFAVAKTQARAGLLLCDELGTALDVFAQIGPPWNTRSLREDLERFWVSEELSRLRAALGR